MKRWLRLSAIIIIILLLSIAGIIFYYAHNNNPKEEVVEPADVVEVFEEFSIGHLNLINLNINNENVKVYSSNNRFIRVVYRPSLDGVTFKYTYKDKVLSLMVGDIEASKGIVPKTKEIIYIYLPTATYKDLVINTKDGFIDINGVQLGSVNFTTDTGYVSLTNTTIRRNSKINTNQGKLYLRDVSFENLELESESGDIYLSLKNDLKLIENEILGDSIYLNGELLVAKEEKEETDDSTKENKNNKEEVNNAKLDIKLKIINHQGNIYINYPIMLEE